jgi:hypothetical protein
MKKTHLQSFADLDKIFPAPVAPEKQLGSEAKNLHPEPVASPILNTQPALTPKAQNKSIHSDKSADDLILKHKKLEDYEKNLREKENQNLARASQLAQVEQRLKEHENKNHQRWSQLDRREVILNEREKVLQSSVVDLNSRISEIVKREAVYIDFDQKLKVLEKENSFLNKIFKEQQGKIQKLTETERNQKESIQVAQSNAEKLNTQISQIRKNHHDEVKSLLSKIDQTEIELDQLRSIQKKYVTLYAKHKEAKDTIRRLESVASAFGEMYDSVDQIGQFHLNNSTIIDWLTSQDYDVTFKMPSDVTVLGKGPIDNYEWISHLDNSNCKSWLNGNEWIIIGREGWNPEDIDALIAERADESIRIVSQEMFLAAMISGKDPFDASEDLLFSFAEGHPALEYIIGSAFEWPFFNEELSDNGPQLDIASVEKSPLKLMDYTVGMNGWKEKYRRKILADAYLGEIPWTESDVYMKAWGRASTRKRMWRIAHHLAMLIRKAGGKYNMGEAINDWESDLDWLYRKFYLPKRMNFKWPF